VICAFYSPTVDFCDLVAPVGETDGEWWYYHGRLVGGGGRYAFHLAFFRRSARNVRIARRIPATRFGDHAWFAHFALGELDAGCFHYAHDRAFFRHTGGADAERRRVWLGATEVRAGRGAHRLRAACGPLQLLIALRPETPVVDLGGAPFARSARSATRYFSCPRLAARGRLRIGGRWIRVTGTAWMDREWGELRFGPDLAGWDWFGIQLRDGCEFMISRVRDGANRPTPYSAAVRIAADGSVARVDGRGFEATPLDGWASPRTGVRYPLRWRLRVPDWKAELRITPLLRCSEIATPGTTNITYWEGPAEVEGTVDGRAVSGSAFTELVGYAWRADELRRFEERTRNVSLLDLAHNEARRWRDRLRGRWRTETS